MTYFILTIGGLVFTVTPWPAGLEDCIQEAGRYDQAYQRIVARNEDFGSTEMTFACVFVGQDGKAPRPGDKFS